MLKLKRTKVHVGALQVSNNLVVRSQVQSVQKWEKDFLPYFELDRGILDSQILQGSDLLVNHYEVFG